MNQNEQIRKLIDANAETPSVYSDDGIRDACMDYTECLQFPINDDDIKIGLERVYEYLGTSGSQIDFNGRYGMETLSCIVTNSVNGKIAKFVNENITVSCFDNDYYCFRASRIVNVEKNQKDKIQYFFGDISQFFTSPFNSTFSADFVVTCPSQSNECYKDLDCEMKYKQMNPYEYYTKRSIEFLRKDGVCMSVVPTEMENFVVKQLLSYDKPVAILNSLHFTGGYSFIFIKKL